MRGRRLPDLATGSLAGLAAVALAAALLLVYAGRTVFDADGFASRADAASHTAPVRAAAARRIVDAAIAAKPDLVALRPLLEAAVRSITGTEAFRSLVRAAARDVHRSAFDREARTVTLTLADAGILVTQAAQALSPELAARLPSGFEARLTRVGGGLDGAALRIAELADRTRRLALVLFAASVVLGLAAVLPARSRRAGIVRLAAWFAASCALVAIAVVVGPRVATSGIGSADGAAARAALGVWLTPLGRLAIAGAAAGCIVALAAASVLRPVEVTRLFRRAWEAVATTPRGAGRRTVRAVAAGLLGVALIVWPAATIAIAARATGAALLLAAVAEILRLTATTAPRARGRRLGRRSRVIVVAAALGAAAVATGALAAGQAAQAPAIGRCNGFRELCGRPLDRVAFAGTHNSMAADGEPGWLFAAQDAGIPAQLREGIRALLVDTHYGIATPRGIATQLAAGSKSRDKIAAEVGETFVRTAERLRDRIGFTRGDARAVYLCHAYCEVGATKAQAAFAEIHRFLVGHPEEVLVLSIEDDTSASATAAAIRASGLSREVYRGPARPPWPTLRELIERDERVLVLVENHPGDVAWLHRQTSVAQETPYRFRTTAELAARASCDPNRGGTRGSLLLVNHWVDTSPAPRPTIADTVNGRPFLERRLATCRSVRNMLPNVVAVDFFRRGDVSGAVNALNGVG
jgi:hypothetical protein